MSLCSFCRSKNLERRSALPLRICWSYGAALLVLERLPKSASTPSALYGTKKLNPPDVVLVKVNRKIGGYANGPNAFQITLKDEKILEMDRHIKTLSVQLSDLQTRLLAAEALSSTLRVELDCAKDDVRSRVTSEASFASMEAALRAKSAQVSTMESLVKAREGQVDAMKRLLAAEAASNSPRPNTAMEDSIPVHQTRQEPSISPAPLMRGNPPR